MLVIDIPLLVLLLALLALEQWRDQLPAWLQRLAERPSWLWNTGIGLIIGLSSELAASAAWAWPSMAPATSPSHSLEQIGECNPTVKDLSHPAWQ